MLSRPSNQRTFLKGTSSTNNINTQLIEEDIIADKYSSHPKVIWLFWTSEIQQKTQTLTKLWQNLIQPQLKYIIYLESINHFQLDIFNSMVVKALTISLLILLATAHFKQLQDTPKMPLYVGRSYNLLEGNPLSDQVDPGFMHSVFQFTYNDQQTTEDGKFLIPDGVSHRKVSSCSFSTDVQTYRGTKSYQEQLKQVAKISGGYKGGIIDAAFSFSSSYEHLEKDTIESNMSITHATAQCQAYELSIDIFTVNTLLPNFISGVNESYHSKNWDKFITQFGTHFVYDATMGGRAVQEISYDFESVSKLNSLDIDISIAAKASFAKFFADSSFDWHKHSEEVEYSEKMSRTTVELYIGGQPPRDGNIHTWVDQVIENPMPINYKVMELSQLFSDIKEPSINVAEAVAQFQAALDQYCQTLNCKRPIPDKPKPPPASLVQTRSHTYGGNGGGPYQFYVNSTTMGVTKFLIRHGTNIDKIQLLLGDGVRKEYSPAQGGSGGAPTQWQVPEGQYVSQVEYRSGDRVDSVTFITNTGVKSPYYGGGGGSYHLETFPDGYRIIGFYGRSGDRVDQLGFILGKTIYPSGNRQNKPQLSILRKNLIIDQ